MVSDKNKYNQNAWWQPAIMIFLRLSAWIAVPVVASTLLGHWLDDKYGTEPILLVITVSAGFFLSMFGLVRETSKEYKKIEKNKK